MVTTGFGRFHMKSPRRRKDVPASSGFIPEDSRRSGRDRAGVECSANVRISACIQQPALTDLLQFNLRSPNW